MLFGNRKVRLLHHIENADDLLLNQIIPLLIRRYSVHHPTHELAVIALPRDNPAEREKILDNLKLSPLGLQITE